VFGKGLPFSFHSSPPSLPLIVDREDIFHGLNCKIFKYYFSRGNLFECFVGDDVRTKILFVEKKNKFEVWALVDE
jgi:hypothetical protein